MNDDIPERSLLRAELREASKTVKQARRQQKSAMLQRPRDDHGRLLVPSGFKAVLLTLFMVSQYDTTIPLMFARGKRKRQIFPADASDK